MANAKRNYHVTLPSSKVIQKFYLDFDNKVAYFLQMTAGSHKDMTLTYGGFNPGESEINLSNNPTQMHLTNFGHGQTFELFTWNNQLYAWVMTYAGSNASTDGDYWATRVARLPIDGTSKTPADVNSITYLNYMGTGKDKNMTLYQADAALSSDKTPLAVWTQEGQTGTKKRVTAFKTDELNQIMDAQGNIKCTDDRMAKGGSAYVSSRSLPNNYDYPQGSWQGMELSNRTNAGYNWVYLTSGQSDDPTVIARAPWNFQSPAPQNVTAAIKDLGGHKHETEPPQLYGDYVYFGVEEKTPDSGKLNEHYIYSISKDSFTN